MDPFDYGLTSVILAIFGLGISAIYPDHPTGVSFGIAGVIIALYGIAVKLDQVLVLLQQ